MSIVRYRSKEDQKVLNQIMEEAWIRYRDTDMMHILSFQDGAWREYKGVRYATEEPEMCNLIYNGGYPDRGAYEAGREWFAKIKTLTV